MAFDPKQMVILLVEDTAMMREIEKRTLAALGFDTVIEAENGKQALAILDGGQRVDLVISDWNMPEMDGLALLEALRNGDLHRGIPFLMATGQGDKRLEHRAMDAGVSSFVAKPFNEEELRAKIEAAIGDAGDARSPSEWRPKLSPDGMPVFHLAHIQITDHLVLGVAKHLVDSGAVSPEHFRLETRCLPGWNPVQSALEDGSVDGALILAPIAMDLFADGTPIRLVLLAHKNGSICVRKAGEGLGAGGVEAFRNTSFFIPHKMSVHHMLAHLFFSKIGLKAGMVGEGHADVNIEVVPPIQMQPFLERQPKASGFMVAEPLGTKAIAAGAAELQFLSSELWENHPCCVVTLRSEVVAYHPEAVQELVNLLVEAGRFIDKRPERAAEIAVGFLDPDGRLGLKVPVLKNVLMEPQGIKTADLFPDKAALGVMQRYMQRQMGIGVDVDLEVFVEDRFAKAACRTGGGRTLVPALHDRDNRAYELLRRTSVSGPDGRKLMLNLEGKYLTFGLGGQEFGIDILRIKEIVGMLPTRSVPMAPECVRGVIDLRGQVVPVVDLRIRLGISGRADPSRECIVILESTGTGGRIGVAVDSVSEVLAIRSGDIQPTPHLGPHVDTRHILAAAKVADRLKLLLDIDRVLAD